MNEVKEANARVLSMNSEIKKLYGQLGNLNIRKLKSERETRNLDIVIGNLEICSMNLLRLRALMLISARGQEIDTEIDR